MIGMGSLETGIIIILKKTGNRHILFKMMLLVEGINV
jgi:hypothetical protein